MRSCSSFFSSDMMERMASFVHFPSRLSFLSRCAWEREMCIRDSPYSVMASFASSPVCSERSDNFVVMILYSSVSLGKRSTKGRITLP